MRWAAGEGSWEVWLMQRIFARALRLWQGEEFAIDCRPGLAGRNGAREGGYPGHIRNQEQGLGCSRWARSRPCQGLAEGGRGPLRLRTEAGVAACLDGGGSAGRASGGKIDTERQWARIGMHLNLVFV